MDARKKAFKGLNREERIAKRKEIREARAAKFQARYDKASPKKKARMDERKKAFKGLNREERIAKRKEIREARAAKFQARYDEASPEQKEKNG